MVTFMGATPVGPHWRKEQAKYAKALLPHTKNPLVRELALLILEEYTMAEPPPDYPNTHVPIAALRAAEKLGKLKGSSIPRPIVEAGILHVTRALKTATAQLKHTIEWRGRKGQDNP